jgi:hypothetical protein
MKTTAVARMLSCMHTVDTEKNAEMVKRMFFKSEKKTVICGNIKTCQTFVNVKNRWTRCGYEMYSRLL